MDCWNKRGLTSKLRIFRAWILKRGGSSLFKQGRKEGKREGKKEERKERREGGASKERKERARRKLHMLQISKSALQYRILTLQKISSYEKIILLSFILLIFREYIDFLGTFNIFLSIRNVCIQGTERSSINIKFLLKT